MLLGSSDSAVESRNLVHSFLVDVEIENSMYLAKLTVENFRCFGDGDDRFELNLKNGLTALVGENDAGKTAVVDALRFALGTTDQEWFRLDDSDFHRSKGTAREIRIGCEFRELNPADKRAFIEYLTYGETADDEPYLCVTWTAIDSGTTIRGRPFRKVEVHSGKDGQGPIIALEIRELLRATYLRPLRDANQALTSGRGSRLSQVLHNTTQIKSHGSNFDADFGIDPQTLNVLGIGDLANALLEEQRGIKEVREQIDKHLKALSLHGSDLKSTIKVGVSKDPEVRLRQLLERLDLDLRCGKHLDENLGLGSGNLLFMACELLLLTQNQVGSKVLLIEEPEAHLHPQRQLRVMKALQEQAKAKHIQIIITTHSPNLASAISLDNIVLIQKRRAFSLSSGLTCLEPSDYGFLSRFLDVTKANLFFARAVMIVEGDAENILVPTLATLIGRDFTERGVSIVNVGGVGLRRYARIFQRKNASGPFLDIPVACVTDMDVMPNCAPTIIGKIKDGDPWPDLNPRRWQAKRDFDDIQLAKYRDEKVLKASGQSVRTFVSDEWTLEYDIALGPKDCNGRFTGGLAEDVFTAAYLAGKDDDIHAGTATSVTVEAEAVTEFANLKRIAAATNGCTSEEVLAAHIYAKFARHKLSKPIAAQYLSRRLQAKIDNKELTAADLRSRLPKYLVDAIEFVTGGEEQDDKPQKMEAQR